MSPDPNDRDDQRPRAARVVVVGAGLSGLVAARTLATGSAAACGTWRWTAPSS
jgi:cation diffusion facilitator CzcD-associated flavoprotein CzcO